MNSKRHSILIAALLSLAAAMLLAGCNSNHIPLADINANPSRYANREVAVVGQVTQVYELPLGVSNLAAYRINDNTGQIWVISHIGAPVVGDKVAVKGQVRQINDFKLPIVGTILGAVVDEHQRRM